MTEVSTLPIHEDRFYKLLSGCRNSGLDIDVHRPRGDVWNSVVVDLSATNTLDWDVLYRRNQRYTIHVFMMCTTGSLDASSPVPVHDRDLASRFVSCHRASVRSPTLCEHEEHAKPSGEVYTWTRQRAKIRRAVRRFSGLFDADR